VTSLIGAQCRRDDFTSLDMDGVKRFYVQMIVEENGPHFGAGQEVVDIITDLGQGLELVLKFEFTVRSSSLVD